MPNPTSETRSHNSDSKSVDLIWIICSIKKVLKEIVFLKNQPETTWGAKWQAVSSSCITAWAASASTIKQWRLWLLLEQFTITPSLSSAENHLIWVHVWHQNAVIKPMVSIYLWHPAKDSPPGIQPALVSRSQWSRWFLLPCHEFCSCCCVYLWCRSQLIISLINTPPPFSTLPPSSLLLLLCSPQKTKKIFYICSHFYNCFQFLPEKQIEKCVFIIHKWVSEHCFHLLVKKS